MTRTRLFTALTVTAALAACSQQGSSPVDGDLKRDLDMAGAASVELGRAAHGTQVVSAIKGGETPAPAPTPR